MPPDPLFLRNFACKHFQHPCNPPSGSPGYRPDTFTSYPPLCSFAFAFKNVLAHIILHFSAISDSHTCTALLLVERNKLKLTLQYKLVYITNLWFVSVCMSGFPLLSNLGLYSHWKKNWHFLLWRDNGNTNEATKFISCFLQFPCMGHERLYFLVFRNLGMCNFHATWNLFARWYFHKIPLSGMFIFTNISCLEFQTQLEISSQVSFYETCSFISWIVHKFTFPMITCTQHKISLKNAKSHKKHVWLHGYE